MVNKIHNEAESLVKKYKTRDPIETAKSLVTPPPKTVQIESKIFWTTPEIEQREKLGD